MTHMSDLLLVGAGVIEILRHYVLRQKKKSQLNIIRKIEEYDELICERDQLGDQIIDARQHIDKKRVEIADETNRPIPIYDEKSTEGIYFLKVRCYSDLSRKRTITPLNVPVTTTTCVPTVKTITSHEIYRNTYCSDWDTYV